MTSARLQFGQTDKSYHTEAEPYTAVDGTVAKHILATLKNSHFKFTLYLEYL